MLLKLIGLICAGVFVAAAVIEVKGRRKKAHDAQAPAKSEGQTSAPLTNSEDTACQVKHSK